MQHSCPSGSPESHHITEGRSFRWCTLKQGRHHCFVPDQPHPFFTLLTPMSTTLNLAEHTYCIAGCTAETVSFWPLGIAVEKEYGKFLRNMPERRVRHIQSLGESRKTEYIQDEDNHSQIQGRLTTIRATTLSYKARCGGCLLSSSRHEGGEWWNDTGSVFIRVRNELTRR